MHETLSKIQDLQRSLDDAKRSLQQAADTTETTERKLVDAQDKLAKVRDSIEHELAGEISHAAIPQAGPSDIRSPTEREQQQAALERVMRKLEHLEITPYGIGIYRAPFATDPSDFEKVQEIYHSPSRTRKARLDALTGQERRALRRISQSTHIETIQRHRIAHGATYGHETAKQMADFTAHMKDFEAARDAALAQGRDQLAKVLCEEFPHMSRNKIEWEAVQLMDQHENRQYITDCLKKGAAESRQYALGTKVIKWAAFAATIASLVYILVKAARAEEHEPGTGISSDDLHSHAARRRAGHALDDALGAITVAADYAGAAQLSNREARNKCLLARDLTQKTNDSLEETVRELR